IAIGIERWRLEPLNFGSRSPDVAGTCIGGGEVLEQHQARRFIFDLLRLDPGLRQHLRQTLQFDWVLCISQPSEQQTDDYGKSSLPNTRGYACLAESASACHTRIVRHQVRFAARVRPDTPCPTLHAPPHP